MNQRPSAESMTEAPIEHWPRWAVELDRTLAVSRQFVISGNIRDVFFTPAADGVAFLPIVPCLFEALTRRGFHFFLIYDRVDGIRVFPEEARGRAETVTGIRFGDGGFVQVSLEELPKRLRSITVARDTPCAFVIDYASRLVGHPQDLNDQEHEFFRACEKLAHTSPQLRAPGGSRLPPFNPIFWLINRANDLPDWFVVGNQSIRTLVAGLPDRRTRRLAATKLARGFSDQEAVGETKRDKLLDMFADLTDGLTLRSMMAIGELAGDQRLPLGGIADAIRCYKVGVPDNPWREEYVAARIRAGREHIQKRVMGQATAVQKSLDILTRSAAGLSGAHVSARGGRPRGVLFFAGPTGVGKTELAKSITELIFGDEQAYKRFDMSEFAAEHSDARLIGAPPGYLGYDLGGELVSAVRQRPFSVLLFDEVEKAHPRILDKFLQILEDGRLTDGRGDTVFFSEAVIVFTSNLGIYVEDEMGRRQLNVSPDDGPAETARKIKSAIEHHFRFNLQRPELLNRIGDNVVVFDFIRQDVGKSIFDKMMDNVMERIREELGLTLKIPDEIRARLLDLCVKDLSNGGRGIGNKLETVFINPFARAVFDQTPERGTQIIVSGITEHDDIYEVVLE